LRKAGGVKLSESGFQHLRQSEGCRLDAYQDEGGRWTIGYGDTSNVKPGDRITPEEAEARLRRRVPEFEAVVLRAVKRPLRPAQFDVLVNFAYNVGPAFGGSTLVRLFNEGDEDGAACEFAKWVYVAGPEAVVKLGDRGPSVLDWQRHLRDMGHAIVCDGTFGPATEAATLTCNAREGRPGSAVGRVREKVISANLVARRVRELVRFLKP
jgi:lysozyme